MARQFNGTNQDLQSSATVDLTAFTKIAFSMWFWWDAYANDDDLLLDFGVGSSSGGFTVDPNGSNGNFNFGTYDAGGANINRYEFARVSAGAWHLLVANCDRAGASAGQNAWTGVWIDNVLKTPSGGSNDLTNNNFGNLTLNVFSRSNSSLFGAGRGAELAIWGGIALGSTDRDALWNSGSGVDARTVQNGSLVRYWQICGSADPEPALVGSETLVLRNAPVSATHPISGSGICSAAAGGGACEIYYRYS